MQLPENPMDKDILAQFYQSYHTQQWFRGANVVPNHPEHMRKTLVVSVNFKPHYCMNEIRQFTNKYNLALDIKEV